MHQGYFVTGTDTGVGKTLFTAALLHALNQQGMRAVGMKPVAAGAELREGQWLNEDVELIREAGIDAPVDLINPYLFREAIAPNIAAERKGVHIELLRIITAYEALSGLAQVVIVEGAGGFRVPLNEALDTADLAVRLQLPVIVVVGMRLGCINHALLTVEAVRQRGLQIAGWVANQIDPNMAAYAENLATLSERIHAPMLAELPHMRQPDTRQAARLIPPRKLSALLTDNRM